MTPDNTVTASVDDALPADRVADFRERFRGTVIEPEDPTYDDARRVWNGMINRYPALVARCHGTADVVEAVTLAREAEVPLAVRGGGHNVAGNAVCDGGVVADLSEMRGVHVDPHEGTARVQGGATLGDVDRETQLFGLATPLGAVSKTGVAGLTLNGGYGHLSREHGLACDNLLSVEVVTADGEVLTASEERNADLFWGLRGGGGNFGVATSLEYRLHEVGPEVFVLFAWHHADGAADAYRAFREFAADADRKRGVLPFFAYVPELEEFPEESWGEPAVAFLGSDRSDASGAPDAFEPFRSGDDRIADHSGPMEFTALQSMLDADYPDGRNYYWKSTYVDEVTDEVIDLMEEYGRNMPSRLSTVDLWQLGGAVADVEKDATAFWHRDKPFMLTFEANWDDPEANDENVAWAREGVEAVRDLGVGGGGYGNFPGFHEDPARATFGDSYDRLVEVKTRYDPTNLFRLNNNVAPRTDD